MGLQLDSNPRPVLIGRTIEWPVYDDRAWHWSYWVHQSGYFPVLIRWYSWVVHMAETLSRFPERFLGALVRWYNLAVHMPRFTERFLGALVLRYSWAVRMAETQLSFQNVFLVSSSGDTTGLYTWQKHKSYRAFTWCLDLAKKLGCTHGRNMANIYRTFSWCHNPAIQLGCTHGRNTTKFYRTFSWCHARRGGAEVAGWTLDRKIRVRFPAYPHRVSALWWQGGKRRLRTSRCPCRGRLGTLKTPSCPWRGCPAAGQNLENGHLSRCCSIEFPPA